MFRTWKMLTMMFLLSAAAIAVMPPTLFAQQKDPAKIDGLEKLQKAIEELDKKLVKLQDSTTDKETIAAAIRLEVTALKDGVLKELTKEIKAVRDEQRKQEKALENQKIAFDLLAAQVNGLQGKGASAADKALMEDMRKSMKSLEDTVAKLGATTARLSMYPPINGDGAPKTGRVRFTNNFSTELIFTINGMPYRVPSGLSMTVADMPAGPLTYSVTDAFGFLVDRQVANLLAGKTFDVTAR